MSLYILLKGPLRRDPDILPWIGEFRPGNKTVWVVFDEESDFLGLRR